MKKMLLLILMATTLIGKSQLKHFIYFQTENKQPFYIRVNDTSYSSNIDGYLVLSRLQSAEYNIVIGFPSNLAPIQQYKIKIDDKDKGYVLKHTDLENWMLFDLQTFELIPSTINKNMTIKYEETNNNDFSKVLAEVTDNSDLLQKKIVVKEKVEKKNEINHREKIKKIYSKSDNSGVSLIYELTLENNKKDTIKLYLPKPKK
jgi:hypothetical protein